MTSIGRVFGGIDAFFRGIGNAFRGIGRWFVSGPGQNIGLALVLFVVGLVIVVEDTARLLDRVVDKIERFVLVVATLSMTLLAFNEYLARDFRPMLGTDLGGLWTITGQMNLALFMLVLVGFVGASVATREGGHLSVDVSERLLSRPSARFVKRFAGLVSAGLCFVLGRAAWHSIYENADLPFGGVTLWPGMAPAVNLIVALMPGEKYGPGTTYADRYAWEDAQFEAGLEFDALPHALGFVAPGGDFPLWVANLVLAVTFGVMALRFLGRLWTPPIDESVPPPAAVGRRLPDVILAGIVPGALLTMALGLWLGTGWMILLASILLVFVGAPLFVAVGVGTVAAWTLIQTKSVELVVEDMLGATKKQELLAIPFFVLAGNLMTQGTMAKKLIAFARALIGHLPGGLGVGAVVACGIFAAISGSSPVTVIAIGSLMFPMMIRDGYSESYSMGVLSTAGGLGIIIPPSIPMIVYSIVVGFVPSVQQAGGVDVTEMFKAGILPGLLIAFALAVYTLYVNWPRPGMVSTLRNSLTDDPDMQGSWAGNVGRTFARGFLSLMLPVVVLGGIYGLFDLRPLGLNVHIAFTVTEAAAVAVVYALFIELVVYRELSPRDIPKIITDSAVMMGSLFLILVLAISLNLFFSWEQLPEKATEWMMANVDSKLGFLIMVNIFLLLLGTVMDILSAILIVAPLLAPIAVAYDIHPIHFGIMFIVNLEMGYLTPPMGINLFVASTVFERPLVDVIKSVVPFLLVMLVCLILIVWIPELSLALLSKE